jgi:hypothetical protein
MSNTAEPTIRYSALGNAFASIRAHHPQLQAFRRDLHAHPGL